jgi:hypothetical protein
MISLIARLSASALEPWQQTRAEFHKGKNLHGSRFDPRLGRSSAGDSGFFTTTSLELADFYANSDTRNEDSNSGDIYAAAPPDKLFDLKVINNWGPVVDAFLDEADRLEPSEPPYFNEFFRKCMKLDSAYSQKEPAKALLSLAYDAAMSHYKCMTGEAGINVDFFPAVIKKLGYDSYTSTERVPMSGKTDEFDVVVYLERPELISHKEEVAKALAQGKPVPTNVLADYPELKS